MHLKQFGFTHTPSRQVTKNKEEIQKSKETGHSISFSQSGLDKTCFQHDMTEGDFKDLLKEQILINHYVIKYFIMLKMQDMDINVHLLQWFTIFLH